MQPIIDKLSIQYKVTDSEVSQLIDNLTDVFKEKLQIRDCMEEIFFISKNIRLKCKNNKTISNIFLGFKNEWDRPLFKGSTAYFNLFMVFNPSKLNSELTSIIRFIHIFLNREWIISSLDLAIDITCPIKDVIIYAPKRKKRDYRGTIYYGKRNSDGALKVYDKNLELAARELNTTSGNLTRIEYTYRPKANNKSPHQLKVNSDFHKRFSIHDISLLDMDSQKMIKENIEKPQNKLSKNKRMLIQDLKNKSEIPILFNDLGLFVEIIGLLKDRIYVKHLPRRYSELVWNQFIKSQQKEKKVNYAFFVNKLFGEITEKTLIIFKFSLQKKPIGYTPLLC